MYSNLSKNLGPIHPSNCLVPLAVFALLACNCKKNHDLKNTNLVPLQGYGMTEACGKISLESPKEGAGFSGSTGTLMPLIESKIVSVNAMKPLPPNQVGEIWIRGPTITHGKITVTIYYLKSNH